MPKATLSTTAPFGFEMDPLGFIEAFRAVGCTSLQFFRNRENPPTPQQALQTAARAGMPYDSIHGVFGPDVDPSSPDAAHRTHCLKIYEEEGRLALELGGPMVVVHPAASGKPGADVASRAMPPDEARRRQADRWPHLDDFLRRLADIGQRLGVTYLIENLMFDCELGHDPVRLAEHVMSVGSPRIRMCFDLGHAHATLSGSGPIRPGAVAVALRVCSAAIGYLHVHDNDGVHDSHLMPSRGGVGGGTPIDWAAVGESLRTTECRAIRMLEVFEAPSLAGPPSEVGARLRTWLDIKQTSKFVP